MRSILGLLLAATMSTMLAPAASAQPATPAPATRLKLGVIGFHHDHVFGFFRSYLTRKDIDIVGYVETDKDLAARIATRYHLDSKMIYPSVDELIEKTHPQAVVTYTSTFEHRAVVEACAKKSVHVMM